MSSLTSSSTLTVSLVQTATHWHDAERNRDMFDGWLEQVPAHTDLVVLPEMFSTGFTMDSGEVAETMGISRGAASASLTAARRNLQKALAEPAAPAMDRVVVDG